MTTAPLATARPGRVVTVAVPVAVGLAGTLLVVAFPSLVKAAVILGALLAAGITLSIVIEALFNVAVMAAAVPFVGVPLPFISFGGSSLVAAMSSVGLLLSVSRVTAKQQSTPTRKTNETLNILGMRGSISRVRQQPIE